MGHEKTLTGLTVALAGANLIYGAGMLESGVTFDCGQLVLDNEFARMIKHVVEGIPVSDELLMLDDIHAVGPFGDFLSRDSTLRHMRSHSQPTLLDRRVREDWLAAGGTDAYSRAVLRAREVLEGHHPDPIDSDVRRQMRAVVQRADAERGVQ
jgi:trimethylamine---corrinoid protein Co-methyltransferase